jgi:serine/threonine-protein kinase
MSRLQASRLQTARRKRPAFLSRYLPPGSRQRRLFFAAGLPLAVVVLLILITDCWIMPAITRHGTEFPLPDFTGLRLFEAQVSLAELDLTHEVSAEEHSPGVGEGVVLQQFPIAGTKVKAGRTVKFVVSLGQKLVAIPEVHGLSVRQAILNLETAELTLGEIAWAYSDTIPERVVVFSYPAAGTEVPITSPVNLMVNRGRASTFTYMPSLVGLPISEATKRLEDKLLKVGLITYRTDENYLPETVLEQSEPPGTELDNGTEIDLVVSST